MSSRIRTCKRACYRGVRWARQAYWAAVRRQASVLLALGEEPEPPRHRHAEKWDRE